jgi:hypothetical protein
MTPPRPTRSKFTKGQVNYRMAKPNGARCGTCTHFASNACEIVAGTIRRGDVCDKYSAAK